MKILQPIPQALQIYEFQLKVYYEPEYVVYIDATTP